MKVLMKNGLELKPLWRKRIEAQPRAILHKTWMNRVNQDRTCCREMISILLIVVTILLVSNNIGEVASDSKRRICHR